MRKSEAEPIIRSLVHRWAEERHGSSQIPPDVNPSFGDFKSWLNWKGYARYLEFRSVGGPDYAAEMWFDQELKQTWRR